MRIDRYWKQAAAGLLAIMTLTMTGGNLDSLAMTNSQPLKAQGQMLSSPDKIIIRDEGEAAQSSQAAAASQPVIQAKAQIAAFGEVTTPKTDSTSLFGAGRLTMLANHDTAAQLLSVIIETGEGGLIVVDGGWTNNTDYLLNQIKQKGGHVQAWLLTHPDSDHVGALADILYKHNGEITIDGIYYSFAEDSWYAEKDPEVAKMVAYIKGAFGLVPQNILHGDIGGFGQIRRRAADGRP